jgi:predicted short-subunit dehydrogenase-like oxidoreductase (DUF2520 family)
MQKQSNSHSLSIIGAGKLGRSLGHLWHKSGAVKIQHVCNQTLNSARDAVAFIGAGEAVTSINNITPCDFLLIATTDKAIAPSSLALSELDWISSTTLFHCSGALSSEVLFSAKNKGAKVASIHPVKSFSSPEQLVQQNFAGTYCGVEGDKQALIRLERLFDILGALFIGINADNKMLYHCAAVMANNYYVALIELAQKTYIQAGLTKEESMNLLAPMLRETTENMIKHGTEQSLTGPIARGDTETVSLHIQALSDWNKNALELYQQLGEVALELSEKNIVNEKMRTLLSSEKTN